MNYRSTIYFREVYLKNNFENKNIKIQHNNNITEVYI